jgi:hypothetical protein
MSNPSREFPPLKNSNPGSNFKLPAKAQNKTQTLIFGKKQRKSHKSDHHHDDDAPPSDTNDGGGRSSRQRNYIILIIIISSSSSMYFYYYEVFGMFHDSTLQRQQHQQEQYQ